MNDIITDLNIALTKFHKYLFQIKYEVLARSSGLEFITFDKPKVDGIEELNNRKSDELITPTEVVSSKTENEGKIDDSNVIMKMVESAKMFPSKKGIEIRFRGMDLHENTATVRVTSISLTVQCSRCKNRADMPNVKEKYVKPLFWQTLIP